MCLSTPIAFPGFSALYRRGRHDRVPGRVNTCRPPCGPWKGKPGRQLSRYLRPSPIQYAHTVHRGPPTDALAVSRLRREQRDTSARITSHPTTLPARALAPASACKKKSYFFVLGNTNFARERGKLDQAAGAKPHGHDAPHNPNQLTRASAACVAEAAPRTRVQPPDVTGPGRYDGSLEASVGPFPPFPPLLGGGVRRTFRDRPGSKGGKEDGNKFRHYPITGRCGVLLEAPAAAPYFSSLRPPPVARLRAKHRVPAAAQQTGFERSPVPRAPRGGWRSTGPCFILDRGGRSPFFPHISFR